jgi:hypothetical protein
MMANPRLAARPSWVGQVRGATGQPYPKSRHHSAWSAPTHRLTKDGTHYIVETKGLEDVT